MLKVVEQPGAGLRVQTLGLMVWGSVFEGFGFGAYGLGFSI